MVACGLAAIALGCSAPAEGRKGAVNSARAYTNPVYGGSMPDHSVIRYKGYYYAFGTTGNALTPDALLFGISCGNQGGAAGSLTDAAGLKLLSL
jgi:hypothetical protein